MSEGFFHCPHLGRCGCYEASLGHYTLCVCVCVCVRERERERQTERETDRERDRQRDRETERESELLPFRSVQKDFSWHLGWGFSSPSYSLACVEEVGGNRAHLSLPGEFP